MCSFRFRRCWKKQSLNWVKTGFETQIFVWISHQGRGMGLRAAALIKGNEAEPLCTHGPRHGAAALVPCFGILAHLHDLNVTLSRF